MMALSPHRAAISPEPTRNTLLILVAIMTVLVFSIAPML